MKIRTKFMRIKERDPFAAKMADGAPLHSINDSPEQGAKNEQKKPPPQSKKAQAYWVSFYLTKKKEIEIQLPFWRTQTFVSDMNWRFSRHFVRS